MPEVSSYDFKKITTTVAGHIVTGFMDGTVITIEKNEDNVTPHVGADGSVTYAESADNTATMTLTLKQTSPSLAVLRGLARNKTNCPSSVINNNNGAAKYISSYGRVLKMPGEEFGTEVSGVEVTIHIADYNPQ